MPKEGQKNFNVNCDGKLIEDFDRQVKYRGYTKYRAVEGALRLWLASSPEQQVKQIYGSSASKQPEEDRVHRIVELLEEFRILALGKSVHESQDDASTNENDAEAL